jgi:hypothetical protein
MSKEQPIAEIPVPVFFGGGGGGVWWETAINLTHFDL